jgi:hypothetical protein
MVFEETLEIVVNDESQNPSAGFYKAANIVFRRD